LNFILKITKINILIFRLIHVAYHRYDNLIAKARMRRRIRGVIVIVILVIISLGIIEGAGHFQSHQSKISVDLTYFTYTLIRNDTVILVPAHSYSVFGVNLRYASSIQGSFTSSLPLVMYILTSGEYLSFVSGQEFGFVFSTGITNGTHFVVSAIPGEYYIVFSNGEGQSSDVMFTSAITASYSL